MKKINWRKNQTKKSSRLRNLYLKQKHFLLCREKLKQRT